VQEGDEGEKQGEGPQEGPGEGEGEEFVITATTTTTASSRWRATTTTTTASSRWATATTTTTTADTDIFSFDSLLKGEEPPDTGGGRGFSLDATLGLMATRRRLGHWNDSSAMRSAFVERAAPGPHLTGGGRDRVDVALVLICDSRRCKPIGTGVAVVPTECRRAT